MKDEYWLRAAMTDDCLVAELLLRLKEPEPDCSQSHPSSRISKGMSEAVSAAAIPLGWGTKQPRSKPSPPPPQKERDPARRSPTTPLSRSSTGGSSSPSCEESDSSLADVRFETFSELKEEESSLLKERAYLEKELGTLRVSLGEQWSLNHKLKRIKIDPHVEESGAKSGVTFNEFVAQDSTASPRMTKASTQGERVVVNDHPLPESYPAKEGVGGEAMSYAPEHVVVNDHPLPKSYPAKESAGGEAMSCAPERVMVNDYPLPELYPAEESAGGQKQHIFVLPDLNMTPEDLGPEILMETR